MTMKEDYDLSHNLLFRPGSGDTAGSDWTYASYVLSNTVSPNARTNFLA
jgi:hypothetical protein